MREGQTQMDKYRSDEEVGVQLYVACTAMQPATNMLTRSSNPDTRKSSNK